MALLKRKRIKKWSLFIIGSFLIAIGIGIIVVKTLLDYQYEKQESKLIDLYIESTTNEYQNVQADNSETKTSNDVEILEESDMPNIKNGNLVLAAHSGTGRYAFFRNLYKLKINDNAYIYYQGLKYEYEIVKIEYQDKDGTITISKLEQESYLILTTCDQKDKTKQIVITAKLINTENY